MGTVKSLKQLLDAADALLERPADTALSKEASDEVSDVVNKILNSDTILTQSDPSSTDFEKAAEAYNRYQALCEIDEICKLSKFCELAEQNGYSGEQIKEALTKVAASRMVKTVPALSSLGFMSFGEDKNELPVSENKTEKASDKSRKSLVESQGY